MAIILLVDDDENILTSVSIFLETEGYTVKVFSDGAAALSYLAKDCADIGVFDIKMPSMDGLELLRRVRQTSDLPVIFLTSKAGEFDEALGLDLGADDYIAKPFSQPLLAKRIKAVLRRAQLARVGDPGINVNDSQVMTRGKLILDSNRHSCIWNGLSVKLTVTEFLLIYALANRPGYVKTRDNLMDAAYDDQVYVDDRTIDSHIKRIRKKFKRLDPQFDGIETLYGVGYRYKEA